MRQRLKASPLSNAQSLSGSPDSAATCWDVLTRPFS